MYLFLKFSKTVVFPKVSITLVAEDGSSGTFELARRLLVSLAFRRHGGVVYIGVQLSHGVLFAARVFAILRGCPSTLHTTAVTKNRAFVRDPKLFSATSNQFKEWVFFCEACASC